MLARLQPARLNKLGETQTQSPKGGLGSLALHGISDQHPANRGMQSFNGVTLRTIKSYEQIKNTKIDLKDSCPFSHSVRHLGQVLSYTLLLQKIWQQEKRFGFPAYLSAAPCLRLRIHSAVF